MMRRFLYEGPETLSFAKPFFTRLCGPFSGRNCSVPQWHHSASRAGIAPDSWKRVKAARMAQTVTSTALDRIQVHALHAVVV